MKKSVLLIASVAMGLAVLTMARHKKGKGAEPECPQEPASPPQGVLDEED